MGRLAKWILFFTGSDEESVTSVTETTDDEEKGTNNPETAEQE